jgi:ATP-dependent Zn protease
MNTIFRSALFPFIVIVLLVYLASQTLMGENRPTTTVHYSQVVQAVESNPHAIERVVIRRNRGVTVERTDGTTWKAANPSEASQLALERRLIDQEVAYDWKNTGSSAWWSLTTALLPFILLMGFWHFLKNRRDERVPSPDSGAA